MKKVTFTVDDNTLKLISEVRDMWHEIGMEYSASLPINEIAADFFERGVRAEWAEMNDLTGGKH